MSIEPPVIVPPVELETDPCSVPEPACAQAAVHSSVATTKTFIGPPPLRPAQWTRFSRALQIGDGAESEPAYSTCRRFLTGFELARWQDGVRRSMGRRNDPHKQTQRQRRLS